MQTCCSEAKAFFAMPESKKAEVRAEQGRAYGYFPMFSEAVGYKADVLNRPDLREAFSMGPTEPLPPPGTEDAPNGVPSPSPIVDFCYQETPWPSAASEDDD